MGGVETMDLPALEGGRYRNDTWLVLRINVEIRTHPSDE